MMHVGYVQTSRRDYYRSIGADRGDKETASVRLNRALVAKASAVIE
jgi:hypothetical protein